MSDPVIRLFRCAVYAWLACYLVALLLLGGDAWLNAPVNITTAKNGVLAAIQEVVNAAGAGILMAVCAGVIAGAVVQAGRGRWWLGLIVWVCFRIVTHRTWLASNGGIQLMENMLLWAALLCAPSIAVATFAFWAARLQLLLLYLNAAAHKYAGTWWLDGTAVLRVAGDPLFHLGWLASVPALAVVLNYAVLAWMTLFPLAVWWRPTRRIVMIAGVLFHLSTAIFMGIPQMGLAIIACYAIWLTEGEARGIIQCVRRSLAFTRWRASPSLPDPGH